MNKLQKTALGVFLCFALILAVVLVINFSNSKVVTGALDRDFSVTTEVWEHHFSDFDVDENGIVIGLQSDGVGIYDPSESTWELLVSEASYQNIREVKYRGSDSFSISVVERTGEDPNYVYESRIITYDYTGQIIDNDIVRDDLNEGEIASGYDVVDTTFYIANRSTKTITNVPYASSILNDPIDVEIRNGVVFAGNGNTASDLYYRCTINDCEATEITFAGIDYVPDSFTVDDNGYLYTISENGREVVAYDPDSGTIVSSYTPSEDLGVTIWALAYANDRIYLTFQLWDEGDSVYYNHVNALLPYTAPTNTPTETPTPTPSEYDNIAQSGAGRVALYTADQGNNALSVMTDGVKTGQTDATFNGEIKTEDYWGIEFSQNYDFNRVVYYTGEMYSDGGWFAENIRVQVRINGDWTNVSNQSIDPAYPYNDTAGNYHAYTFIFDTINGDAIRVVGVPGGDITFVTIAELEIYNDLNGHPTGTPTPTATPTPTPTSGYVLTLPGNLSATLEGDSSVDVTTDQQVGNKTLAINDISGVPLAVISANFTDANLNWEGVTADTRNSEGKAFVHNLTSATNAGASYSLFIPVPSRKASESVYICPGVASLEAIEIGCTDGAEYGVGTYGSIVVSKARVNKVWYWKVSGLTGTGGVSLVNGFNLEDDMSRVQANTTSSHLIKFGTVSGINLSGQNIVIDFTGSGWNFNGLSVMELDFKIDGTSQSLLTDEAGVGLWGVVIDNINTKITLIHPTSGIGSAPADALLDLAIEADRLINPLNPGQYSVDIQINNGGDGEEGSIALSIVDSDTVNITGFVNSFLSFDIDTGTTDEVDCAFDVCTSHEHGSATANYTVDLGELNSTWVNKSRDVSVMHADGNDGLINSIFLDISTNAINGVTVYVKSQNSGLQGPHLNIIHSIIDDGETIIANSGLYGYQLTTVPSGNGTLNRNGFCLDEANYCKLIDENSYVFDSNNQPVDNGRVEMRIAAAASYNNNPGNYTDTLTFVAVPTY